MAEVLVTLGIIGVVSAMTVPSLMQNYQRQSYVTQLHKFYNETSQAVMQYVNDKNALNISEAGLLNDDAIDIWIKNYFRIVQTCENISDCFADEYKSLNGNNLGVFLNDEYSPYVLASGASIALVSRSNCILLDVDVNGKKGPNILGRDLFAVKIYLDGQLDDAVPPSNVYSTVHPTTDEREEVFNNYCSKMTKDSLHSWGCFGKILNDNWQMTY